MAGADMSMAEKLKATEPYNIFFTKLSDSPRTHNEANSIDFTDLLCPSLGKLKSSLHLTYLLEIKWLMDQYESKGLGDIPQNIIFSKRNPESAEDLTNDDGELEEADPAILEYKNVNYDLIKFIVKGKRGKHHSRLTIHQYEDGSIRVIVSTANLWSADWGIFQNVLWVSPVCPPLEVANSTAGDSPTGFKRSLLDYLNGYENRKCLTTWLDLVKKADFSNVKVFLVSTHPGLHDKVRSNSTNQHILSNILSNYCNIPSSNSKDWALHVNISGIGYFGRGPHEWLNYIQNLLECRKGANFVPTKKPESSIKIIYPTKQNVADGNGYGFKYEDDIHKVQLWLKNHLCQWKADDLGRSSSMSAAKTYCRISPCGKKLAWFLLTSANLSRNGWGTPMRGFNRSILCKTYEVGVLFVPEMFDKTDFKIRDVNEDSYRDVIPLLYDLPLTPYGLDDYPFCK